MTTMQDAVIEHCKQNKIKKQDFAKRINVTPAKLSHWFAGRTRFSFATLEKIEKILQETN